MEEKRGGIGKSDEKKSKMDEKERERGMNRKMDGQEREKGKNRKEKGG